MGHGLVHVPLILRLPVLGVPAEVQLVHWVVTVTYYHKVPGAPRTCAHVFGHKQEINKITATYTAAICNAIFKALSFVLGFVYAEVYAFGAS